MNLKTFIFGLLASFGLPWLIIVAIPYAKMQNVEPTAFDEEADGKTGMYQRKTSGLIDQGMTVYNANGCIQCHTRIVRPTYAGADMWHNDMAGVVGDEKLGDSRRESVIEDYSGEEFSQIGLTRNGPDLSNVGRRVLGYVKDTDLSAEDWFLLHFQNPRADATAESQHSTCPSLPFLFELKPVYAAQPSADALPVRTDPGKQLLPTQDARALASFLASLKRDDKLPASRSMAMPKAAKK